MTMYSSIAETKSPSVIKSLGIVLVSVLGGLVVLFGLLNFFNILRLSTLSPQLSFLPHLSETNSNSVVTTTTGKSPTSIPTDTYLYDATIARNKITSFMNTSLTTTTLPKDQLTSLSQQNNSYILRWGTDSLHPSTVRLEYVPQSQTVNKIVFNPGIITSTSALTASLAQTLEKKYLTVTVDENQWKCVTDATGSITCSVILPLQNTKHHITVFNSVSSKQRMVFFDCYIPQESPLITNSTGCLVQ